MNDDTYYAFDVETNHGVKVTVGAEDENVRLERPDGSWRYFTPNDAVRNLLDGTWRPVVDGQPLTQSST